MKLRVNGVEKQNQNTAVMIFSVARCIAELSKGTTLEPGDIIATGTPEGVGFARTPPEFLADGDVMEVEILEDRGLAQPGRRRGGAVNSSRRRFLGGAAAGLAAATVPAAVRAQGRRPLAIGYVPSTLFAPVFLAVEKGYLRDAGFDVDAQPDRRRRRLDGVGRARAIRSRRRRALGGVLQRGEPWARREVRRIDGVPAATRRAVGAARAPGFVRLRGCAASPDSRARRSAGSATAAPRRRTTSRASCARSGLHLGDIEPVNVANPDQEVALERKAIDAVFTSAPFSGEFERRRLAAFLASPPPGIAASGVFFGPGLLRDGERARAVMDALRRAAAEIAGSGFFGAANVEACAKYTKQPASVIASSPRYDVKPDLRIDEGTLEDMQREFLADGVLTYKDPLNEVRLVARF